MSADPPSKCFSQPPRAGARWRRTGPAAAVSFCSSAKSTSGGFALRSDARGHQDARELMLIWVHSLSWRPSPLLFIAAGKRTLS